MISFPEKNLQTDPNLRYLHEFILSQKNNAISNNEIIENNELKYSSNS